MPHALTISTNYKKFVNCSNNILCTKGLMFITQSLILKKVMVYKMTHPYFHVYKFFYL